MPVLKGEVTTTDESLSVTVCAPRGAAIARMMSSFTKTVLLTFDYLLT